jgi:hypothetical protein
MTRTSKKPQPVKDALSRKWRPRVIHKVLVADPEPATVELGEALQQRRLATAKDDPAAVRAAERAVKKAQAAYDACWLPITLFALRDGIPALAKLHPPTEEQKAQGAEWNPNTFQPALIAACAEEAGMTEQEWAEELASGRWSTAERNALFGAALEVNLSNSDERFRRALGTA